jgi:hypothetical protein
MADVKRGCNLIIALIDPGRQRKNTPTKIINIPGIAIKFAQRLRLGL